MQSSRPLDTVIFAAVAPLRVSVPPKVTDAPWIIKLADAPDRVTVCAPPVHVPDVPMRSPTAPMFELEAKLSCCVIVPAAQSITIGFVHVWVADVNVFDPRPANVKFVVPEFVIAETSVTDPKQSVPGINRPPAELFAHAGVFVAPVQLIVPMRGISQVIVRDPASILEASMLVVSWGRGARPVPAVPLEAFA